MREILFRGKRVDNGEWIEGQLLYFKSSDGSQEFALIVESCEWDNSNEWFNLGKRAKVIPETIGQYTGLKDKNGKKIFEGDIIKYIDEETTYTVMFDPTGYWCLDGNGARNSEMLIYHDHYKYIEVIGNIYDKEVK